MTSKKTDQALPIAAVERDTGLGKDTLRVWERRYGFPRPLRDEHGERLYPPEQVERLHQIRRLMDQGLRPGKLLGASEAEFAALLNSHAPSAEPLSPPLAALQRNDLPALNAWLLDTLAKHGLQDFVISQLAPLNVAVGEAWARGQLSVAQEHLYTEAVQTLLRAQLHHLPQSDLPPCVLLTTLPEELHTLGLLMAQTLLVEAGASCTSLGAQTPVAELATTLTSGEHDVLLLAFSNAFSRRSAIASLQALAASLPPDVEIWAGGRLVAERPVAIAGVRYLENLSQILDALADWRREHGVEMRGNGLLPA